MRPDSCESGWTVLRSHQNSGKMLRQECGEAALTAAERTDPLSGEAFHGMPGRSRRREAGRAAWCLYP